MRLKPLIIALLLSNSLPSIANPDKAPAIQAHYPVQQMTDNSFVIHASTQTPNPQNQGFMNNVGIIFTDAGIVVVDPGGTVQAGEWVLARIAEKSQDPVVAVFNTHIHGDHWLANQAIKAAYPKVKIYAHPNMIAEAKAEGQVWVDDMLSWTEGASLGTQAVIPTQAVKHGDKIKIGNKSFKIYHYEPAHTKTDIMIEVIEDSLIFTGDNVFNQRMTRMDDGNFAGNISAIDHILALKLKHYIPGHGPSGGIEIPQHFQAYLKTLYQSVKKYYDQGLSDFEIKDKLRPSLNAWQDWPGFDRQLGKHISLSYLEIEAADF